MVTCKAGGLTLEEGEGAVLQLHDNALHDFHHGRDVQEEELNGLVRAEHVPARQGVEQRVGDLAGRAGDAHAQRLQQKRERTATQPDWRDART